MSDHERWLELAAGYSLHALEPAEESLFEAHLAGCDRCGRELAGLSDTAAALAAVSAEETAPAGLWDRIAADLDADDVDADDVAARAVGAPGWDALAPRPLPPLPPAAAPAEHRGAARRRPSTHRRTAWRTRVLAAAAALALVATGLSSYVAATRDSRPDPAAQVALSCVRDSACTAVPLTSDGRVVATALVQGGTVRLLSGGLAPNDTARNVYVLWQLLAGGQPRPVAAFDVASDAATLVARAALPAPAGRTRGFAVSREPGRRMPATPTRLVAEGTLAS